MRKFLIAIKFPCGVQRLMAARKVTDEDFMRSLPMTAMSCDFVPDIASRFQTRNEPHKWLTLAIGCSELGLIGIPRLLKEHESYSCFQSAVFLADCRARALSPDNRVSIEIPACVAYAAIHMDGLQM